MPSHSAGRPIEVTVNNLYKKGEVKLMQTGVKLRLIILFMQSRVLSLRAYFHFRRCI